MKKLKMKRFGASGLMLFALSFFLSAEAQTLKSLSGANSPQDDTNPVWIGNTTLLFTRAFHPMNKGGATDSGDIWMTKKSETGEWEEAVHRPDLSTAGYDFVLGLEDALTLLVYHKEVGKVGIYQYSKFGNDWNFLRPVNMPGINSFEGPVTGRVAAGGKFIFLSGKGEGTLGNEDIYLSEKTGVLDWSTPTNLGPAINTNGQEMGPFYDVATQQLYFSSNMHLSANGKDIFISKKLGDDWNSWSLPVKWEQISSPGSDVSLTFLDKDNVVWTSTQNSDGYADLLTFAVVTPLIIPQEFISAEPVAIPAIPASDALEKPISQVSAKAIQEVPPKPATSVTAKPETVIPAKPDEVPVKPAIEVPVKPTTEVPAKPAPQQVLEAKPIYPMVSIGKPEISFPEKEDVEAEQSILFLVIDSKTQTEIPYDLTWEASGNQISSKSDQPVLLSDLSKSGVQEIKVISAGYFHKSLLINEINRSGPTQVLMVKAEPGSAVLLDNVAFARGTAELEGEQSKASLILLAAFLKENPTVKIRINGHTDNAGDPGLNKALSLQRAGSIRNFLIEQGVAEDNLRTSGWGGTKPVASNATEEGRVKNRRVEIQVEK